MHAILGRTKALVFFITVLFLSGCALSPGTGRVALPSAPQAPAQPLSPEVVVSAISTTGCGKPATDLLGKSVVQRLDSGGKSREYLLHLPLTYQSNNPTPLLLAFHGHGNGGIIMEKRSGFSAIADKQDLIVVYPEGLRGRDGATGWSTTARRAADVDDILFASDLITELQRRFCIDAGRIYAVGFSNGGGMTNLLACSMAGRIAAFAAVSGAYPPDPYRGGCKPSRPMPVLELHGTNDGTVPYDGKTSSNYPPIMAWLNGWAVEDGCSKQPMIVYDEGTVTGLEWTQCKGGAEVLHYRIKGGGHVWPDSLAIEPARAGEPSANGGKLNGASLVIWSFFLHHTLAEPSVRNNPGP